MQNEDVKMVYICTDDIQALYTANACSLITKHSLSHSL